MEQRLVSDELRVPGHYAVAPRGSESDRPPAFRYASPRRSGRGFTLVELVATISIVAILAMIGLPAMQTFMMNNRRAATMNELLVAFSFARSEAIATSNLVTICRKSSPNPALLRCGVDGDRGGWQNGWIVFADPNGSGFLDTDETPIKVGTLNLPDSVTIEGNDNVRSRVTFQRIGRLNGVTNGTLVYCDQRGYGPQSHALTISITGNPRIQQQLGGSCTP